MNLRHIHDCDTYAELVSLDGASSESYAGRTWKHLKADGTLIDVAIFARALMQENVPAVLIAAVPIGAKDMAFPRLNALSYWLFLLGGLIILVELPRRRRRRQRRLDGVHAALDARSSAPGRARTSGSSAST